MGKQIRLEQEGAAVIFSKNIAVLHYSYSCRYLAYLSGESFLKIVGRKGIERQSFAPT